MSIASGIDLTSKYDSDRYSFIDELSSHILDRIPTNPLWATTLSLQTLSTVCQNTKFVTVHGKLNLNSFSLIIGPSGLAYKSIPVRSIISSIIKQLSDVADKDFLLPSRFSLEAMIEHLSHEPSGIILADEFTQVIKSSLSKSYQADMMEFLTELYDGKRQARRTRITGLEMIEEPYVSFLSTTTPYAYRVLKPEHFQQGLGNRFLYIVSEVKEPTPINREDFFRRSDTDDLKSKNHTFAVKLAELYKKLNEKNYTFYIDDTERIFNYVTELEKRGTEKYKENVVDPTYSYYFRAKENFFKILALRAISENYNFILNTSLDIIPIREKEIEWSIDTMNKYIKNFETLVTNWYAHDSEKQPVKTLEKHLDFVKEILRTNGGRLSRTELRGKTSIPQNLFADVISILVSRGDIKLENVAGKTKPLQFIILKPK